MAKAPSVPGQALEKKLSIKGLGFSKAKLLTLVLSDQSADHALARIVGVCSAPRPYKQTQGERAGEIAFGLLGQFEGTNLVTGETMNAAVCYLPEYATEMVLGALAAAGDGAAIQLAFDIYAHYDEKAATSYVFSVRDLLNAAPAGVAEVKEMISALPPPPTTIALPAPNNEPEA